MLGERSNVVCEELLDTTVKGGRSPRKGEVSVIQRDIGWTGEQVWSRRCRRAKWKSRQHGCPRGFKKNSLLNEGKSEAVSWARRQRKEELLLWVIGLVLVAIAVILGGR